MNKRKTLLAALAVAAFGASMTAVAIDACWICNAAYKSCLRSGVAQSVCWARLNACVTENSPGTSCGS